MQAVGKWCEPTGIYCVDCGSDLTSRSTDSVYMLLFFLHSPESIIYSDEWRAYSTLSSLEYTHRTVNHSQHFVDPNTGAHTQTVERMWGACKGMMCVQKTMHSCLFETYLLEEKTIRQRWNEPFPEHNITHC